ncbi:hypothetical protein [Clostridium paraputrificum]|uniref:hypothetical protein n=1 Tax=Clostridium paraputrificum TaxID=29363 RepID=UPI000426772C|nr:hypothetical protein [Clostridium paraputrificum]
MVKKKQNSDICSEDVEILDNVWDQEEKIFRDPTARTVMTFNFQEPDDEALLSNETEKNATNQLKEKSISDKSRNDTVFNNFTVGVINNDKEAFDCKRSYALRKSTVKILNELKGFSLDVNMPVGEIVDDAIRYYYYYVTNQL